MEDINWKGQHCGVHQASFDELIELMPEVGLRVKASEFPENPNDFIWDVKVHMLMPNQFPCIPNWHFDNVPRVNNIQDFEQIDASAPMYLWLSNAPLTEFRKDGRSWHVKAGEWIKFTQKDEHRGTVSNDFCWRGFIRATHKSIAPQRTKGRSPLRRHCQVYLDSSNFSW